MSSTAPAREHFQELANLVYTHAMAKGWPAVLYQAGFVTVVQAKGGAHTLEGNSTWWNADWDDDDARTDHPVTVGSGAEAWHRFLAKALYSDLIRADAELQRGP